MILRKKLLEKKEIRAMRSIKEQLVLVYCLVDDGLKARKTAASGDSQIIIRNAQMLK